MIIEKAFVRETLTLAMYHEAKRNPELAAYLTDLLEGEMAEIG